MMKKFLSSVVDHYFGKLADGIQSTSNDVDRLAMTRYLFVFPSRRSSLFFNQYLFERFKQPVFAPQSTTIADLFALFSDVKVASHTQLLLRLYKIYNEVIDDTVAEHAKNGDELHFKKSDFDSFVFWGDMLLHDFDDVDKYLVDAKQLFHNVRDLKQIEQELGGPDSEVMKIIKSFWQNVNLDDGQEDTPKHRFGYTWNIMFEVYDRFKNALLKEGLAYEGLRERRVVEQIQLGKLSAHQVNLPEHIVFVGITAINETERALFKWLQSELGAEFCWDYADPHLKPRSDEEMNGRSRLKEHENPANAAFFSKRNLKEFPNALADEELDPYIVPEEERKMFRMAVPSGVGQAVEAAKILQQWDEKDAMNTAVVLPDEHLLVPMLYAVPSKYQKYNVTMGYGLRQTHASALVDLLCQLQNSMRQTFDKSKEATFYYQSVLQVLGHSYLVNLECDATTRISQRISKDGLFNVPVSLFADTPLLSAIFKPVNSFEEASNYLDNIFAMLLERYDKQEESMLERESLLAYQQLIVALNNEIKASPIPAEQLSEEGLSRNTLFRLLQRLAQGESVAFSGEPLSGLQIMGILETRSLDFERIILLSMNEGVFPSKPSQNSFIPNTLRIAFGLPTQRHKDSVISYHFYRLLSRAKEVYMLYDCRTSGMQSGEQSRYLLQLQYLSKGTLQTLPVAQEVTTEDVKPFDVKKTKEVMNELRQYRSGQGTRSLSASSLKTYLACPLQFYLSYVQNLKSEDELEEEMADAQFGDILHNTMELLYKPVEGKRIQADFFDLLLDKQTKQVRKAIDEAVKKLMPNCPKTGYMELILKMVEEYVESILMHDRMLTPFVYLASESKQKVQYAVDDALTVNLAAVYDRLDICLDKGNGLNTHESHLRVVDYKTGNANKGKKLAVPNIASLFESDGKASKEAFQVMFYCLMLKYASPETLQQLHLSPASAENIYTKIEPHLYFSRLFVGRSEEVKTILTNGDAEINDFDQYANEMEDGLKKLLKEIFDDQVPFSQCENPHTCSYCDFKAICGRV